MSIAGGMMGLSEREQQLLEDMERRLYQSEADVVSAQSPGFRLNLRALVLGIVVFLFGLGAMVVGVSAQSAWFGLLGFVVMFSGVLLAFSRREGGQENRRARSGRGANASGVTSLNDRAQRRWQERMQGER